LPPHRSTDCYSNGAASCVVLRDSAALVHYGAQCPRAGLAASGAAGRGAASVRRRKRGRRERGGGRSRGEGLSVFGYAPHCTNKHTTATNKTQAVMAAFGAVAAAALALL
jgi:hypothetical protein